MNTLPLRKAGKQTVALGVTSVAEAKPSQMRQLRHCCSPQLRCHVWEMNQKKPMRHQGICQPQRKTSGQQTPPFIAKPLLALKTQFPGAGWAERGLLCWRGWGEVGSDASRSPGLVEMGPGESNSGEAVKVYNIQTYVEKRMYWCLVNFSFSWLV